MNKEKAINLITEFMVIDDWSLVYLPELHNALELAIEVLKELPFGVWIPCTERLPKVSGIYLVTKRTSMGGLFSSRSYFFSKNIGWSDSGVLAWLPMPEPYKEEGEAE